MIVNKNILVTGGAGFIGSHLVKKLLELGFNVRVLDNFVSGKKENLNEVLDRVQLLNGDVTNDADVEKAINGMDAVIHLAAIIDVQHSFNKPILYHNVNSTGTLKLLYNSTKEGIRKFVFISTCAVYEDPFQIPISKEHPLQPLSLYAASKLSAEGYCQAYYITKGLNTIILRPFNVFGPGQNSKQYAGVITEFIKRIRIGLPPVILGDGEQTRDFIFITDLIDLLVKAIQCDASGTFNVGTGYSTSINELAKFILRIMKKEYLKPIHSDPMLGK